MCLTVHNIIINLSIAMLLTKTTVSLLPKNTKSVFNLISSEDPSSARGTTESPASNPNLRKLAGITGGATVVTLAVGPAVVLSPAVVTSKICM